MSRFVGHQSYVLQNEFTIIEKNEKQGRDFILTCAPQSLYIDIHNISISHHVEWQDKVTHDEHPNYRVYSVLSARGQLNDRIVTFNVPNNKDHVFDEIEVISIHPLQKGHVGGKRLATRLDGIKYSVMPTEPIPHDGLLVGEPGRLLFIDPTEHPWEKKRRLPYLHLEAYIDEIEFNLLIEKASRSILNLGTGKIRLLVELFQHEVDAAFSEPWYRRELGFLIKENQTGFGFTRARVDALSLTHSREQQPESQFPK